MRTKLTHMDEENSCFPPSLRALCVSRERVKKNYSHSAGSEVRAVFLGFGFVSAQLQGPFEPAPSPKADDRHHSPKTKNPRSEWPQFFFNRSSFSRYLALAQRF
jgi:hypothetical protein